MSRLARNLAPTYGNVRRARLLREGRPRPTRAMRPWAEVSVAGALVQTATPAPPHIRQWQWIGLAALVLVAHGTLVWYAQQHAPRQLKPQASELNIEIVRPAKPPQRQKVEPPKPPPPQKVKRAEARPLPQISQPDPLPSASTEAVGEAVAVAPVAEPAPPPPPAPEPVTEPMGRAGYLNNPAPEYPPLAVRQNWQGTVTLRVHVLASGSADTVEVKQSSGKKLLDEEAVRTVKRWTFAPAKRGQTAIDGWATVPIEFLLDQ